MRIRGTSRLKIRCHSRLSISGMTSAASFDQPAPFLHPHLPTILSFQVRYLMAHGPRWAQRRIPPSEELNHDAIPDRHLIPLFSKSILYLPLSLSPLVGHPGLLSPGSCMYHFLFHSAYQPSRSLLFVRGGRLGKFSAHTMSSSTQCTHNNHTHAYAKR